jgi:hypothetical protein
MKIFIRFFLLLLVSYLNLPNLSAQIAKNDSSLYSQTLQYTINFYRITLKENLRLYYGNEYISIANGVKGTPFFKYDKLQPGSVFYNGILYDEVPLLYDVYQDAVVINDYTNSFPIKLVSEKISYFKLADHSFIRLSSENTAASLGTGFYEVLYNNNEIMILAKRVKKLFAGSRAEESQQFVQKDQLYIKKNNTYYSINNRKNLMAIFPDKKDDVKKYWKESNFNFKKDLESAVVKTTEYYMQLNK